MPSKKKQVVNPLLEDEGLLDGAFFGNDVVIEDDEVVKVERPKRPKKKKKSKNERGAGRKKGDIDLVKLQGYVSREQKIAIAELAKTASSERGKKVNVSVMLREIIDFYIEKKGKK